jgi:hypothetical protein
VGFLTIDFSALKAANGGKLPDIPVDDHVVTCDATRIVREFLKHRPIPRDHPNPVAYIFEYYATHDIP